MYKIKKLLACILGLSLLLGNTMPGIASGEPVQSPAGLLEDQSETTEIPQIEAAEEAIGGSDEQTAGPAETEAPAEYETAEPLEAGNPATEESPVPVETEPSEQSEQTPAPAGAVFENALALTLNHTAHSRITRELPGVYFCINIKQSGDYTFTSGGDIAVTATLLNADGGRIATFKPDKEGEDGAPAYFSDTIRLTRGEDYYLYVESAVISRTGAFTLTARQYETTAPAETVEAAVMPETTNAAELEATAIPETTETAEPETTAIPETTIAVEPEATPAPEQSAEEPSATPEGIPEASIVTELPAAETLIPVETPVPEGSPAGPAVSGSPVTTLPAEAAHAAVITADETAAGSVPDADAKPALDILPDPSADPKSIAKPGPGALPASAMQAKGITLYPESAHPYANSSDIYWYYYEPDAVGYRVIFSSDTDFENGYDMVYFYDSAMQQIIFDADSATYMYFTGTQLAGKTLTISRTGFYIRLKSDYSITRYGFRIISIVPIYAETTSAVLYICEQSGPKSARLTYNKVTGADGYTLYRGSSEYGTYAAIKSVEDIYTDTSSLIPGQQYWFKVRPFTLNDTTRVYGGYSNAKSVSMLAAPVITSATVPNTSAQITWTAVAGAEGYQLFRSNTLNGTYVCLKSITATSTTNGIVPNTDYYYKVRAYRTYSTRVFGEFSAPRKLEPYYAPVMSYARQQGPDSATIAWSAVAGADGYTLYCSTSQNGTYATIKSVAGISAVSGGLAAGQQYWYKVRSYELIGSVRKYSGYSNPLSVSMLATPVISSATRTDSTTALITWEPVDGAAGYTLYRSTTASGTYTGIKSVTGTSTTNGSLQSITYYYKIAAYVMNGTAKAYSNKSAAMALTTSTGPYYRACLIGQSDYWYASTLHSTYDAGHMKNTLNNLNMGGKQYIVSRYSNLTGTGILSAISSAFAGATANDVSLFFYSGHGVADTSTMAGALCGIDVGNGYINAYVTPSQLRSALDNIPGTVIVLLDSCGSGSYIYAKDGAESQAITKEGATAFNSAIASAFSGVTVKTGELLTSKYKVLTACAYNTYSYESSSGGVYFGYFTKALCAGGGYNILSGTTTSLLADSSGNSIVTLAEAYTYIRNNTNLQDQVVQIYPSGSTYTLFRR